METGKPGLASAPVHISSVAALTEKKMDIQAPLTALYIHTMPALPAQPYLQPPAAAPESSAIHLAVPPLYSKDTLPFLTLHIAGGLQCQLQGLNVAAAPTGRVKSAGKHVCPHCGRDCMKPSVLEKHLRCHTGERPYPCTTCGVSFKTQSNLYKHKRTQAHARLSSESDQSSMGSQDSLSSSRETCTSSLSLEDRSEELDTIEKAGETVSPAGAANVCSGKHQSSVAEENQLTEANANEKLTTGEEKQRTENEKPPVSISRHLPLQRQEATLFYKQWESSVCRRKSQNHESTDSGFSESSDQYPSPGSLLPDHSMDSLTEFTKEHLEDAATEPLQSGQEPKDATRQQEQKTLAERISKLISENSAVVEDKQLENVRPRKTVLSKQGSIDLPMPYTYKDSFHFDMRIGKSSNAEVQRNRNPGPYSSVPTQSSTTMSHVPLTRSNSLPFSVALLQPERSSPSQSDYATLIRRGSSGQINPTGFSMKPVNQQSSTHRPLVRQTAVDCNHAPDAPFMNSSAEEASTGSLSCDRDGGDICGEPSNRKFRRKKTQKFAYNKWYMYGGGTFKKLYSTENNIDGGVGKSTKSLPKPDRGAVQGIQKSLTIVQKEACRSSCPPARLPLAASVDLNSKPPQLQAPCSSLRRNLSLSALPLPLVGSLATNGTERLGRVKTTQQHTCSTSQPGEAYIPSDRKKQKTDDRIIHPLEMEITPNKLSVTGSTPQQHTKLTSSNPNANFTPFKEALFPSCIINVNSPSMSTPPAAAKTSFLPKYQLKLPNAAEPTPTPPQQTFSRPPDPDHCSLNSGRSSCQNKQPSLSAPEKKCEEQTCDFPVLCQAETFGSMPDHQNGATNSAGDCQQLATNTTTLTYVHGFHTGSCSTSTQNLSLRTSLDPTLMQIHPAGEDSSDTPSGIIQPASSAIASFSQDSKLHASVAPETPAPENGPTATSNTAGLPGAIVPYDLMQPSGQNVFHVHTSDLQICFQIISDEQLALIEPQIERQVTSAGSSSSQRCEVEAEKKRPQISVGEEKPGQQKEVNQNEALLLLNMEQLKSTPSVLLDGQSSQAALSDELKPSESLHPPKYNQIKVLTETLTSACNLTSQQSGQNHKPEADCGSIQRGSTEEQAGTVCETPAGPQTLCPANITSFTPKNKLGRSLDFKENQQQTNTTHGALFNGSTMKTASLEIAESVPHAPVALSLTSTPASCAGDSMQPSSSQNISSTTRVNKDRDRFSLSHAGKQSDQFTPESYNSHMETATTPLLTSIQSPTAGLTAGVSITDCGAQMEKERHGGTPGQPQSSDCKSQESQEARETNLQSSGPLDRSGTVGEDRGTRTMGVDTEPGQCRKCAYRHNASTDWTHGEERKGPVDSIKNSWYHLSQTHPALSESLPPTPQHGPHAPSNLSSPPGPQTGAFNPPQPLQMNSLYFPHQHWESSAVTQQYLCQTNSAPPLHQEVQSEQPQPSLRHTLSQLDHSRQIFHQVTCAARGSTVPSCCSKSTAGSHRSKYVSLSSDITTSLSSAVSTSVHIGGTKSSTAQDIRATNWASDITAGQKPPEPKDYTTYDYTTQSGNAAGDDMMTNKYQSYFLMGQLHSCQPECMATAVRPVPVCQDYADGTSSSDDEGKLIIEL